MELSKRVAMGGGSGALCRANAALASRSKPKTVGAFGRTLTERSVFSSNGMAWDSLGLSLQRH